MALSQAPVPRSREAEKWGRVMKGSALPPAQAQEQKALVHRAYLGIHPPQPSPAWSKASPSPVMLYILEDMTAQALGTGRQVEKPKNAGLGTGMGPSRLLYSHPAPETVTSSLGPATVHGLL